ncbi:hypothetical protein OEV82_13090 [Caldibacillus thermolactis]|uniref:Uncharacterized protein n=1 Tax=Pallidibacillus thermolactis TaxID=251051 RepID=A0ABT2WI98_9BACI|nr:hypothetical protein [Pallidibacillus thermolactis]MCU9595378.1 hypothetical protein [Pallidibacillus thermolactis]
MGKFLAYYCLGAGLYCLVAIFFGLMSGQVLSTAFLLFLGIVNLVLFYFVNKAEQTKKRRPKLRLIKT